MFVDHHVKFCLAEVSLHLHYIALHLHTRRGIFTFRPVTEEAIKTDVSQRKVSRVAFKRWEFTSSALATNLNLYP